MIIIASLSLLENETRRPTDITKVDRFDDLTKALLQAVRLNPSIHDKELAAKFGRTTRTISSIRNQPEFKATLEKLIEEQGKSGIQLFLETIPDAIRILKKIMKDPESPPAARVAAAKTFIDKVIPDKLDLGFNGQGFKIEIIAPPIGILAPRPESASNSALGANKAILGAINEAQKVMSCN